MITLFTIPKPFTGHFGAIQHNAIRSWALLEPKCNVILIGDEPGTAQTAAALGVSHAPGVARNRYGTPLLNDVFRLGDTASQDQLLCYVNADIILMNDFTQALQGVMSRKRNFLMVGRRWDTPVQEEERLDFSSGWQQRLTARVQSTATQQGPTHIDYFAYRRGLWGRVPPFAVGRFTWDNWLIWQAHTRKAPVIDASDVVTAVHQNHDYSHAAGGYKGARFGPEARENLALAGGSDHHYTIWDSTHVLTKQGLERRKQTGLGGGIWSYRRSSRLGA